MNMKTIGASACPGRQELNKRENPKRLTSKKKSGESRSISISTAEAFHRVFRALPKKDRLTVFHSVDELRMDLLS